MVLDNFQQIRFALMKIHHIDAFRHLWLYRLFPLVDALYGVDGQNAKMGDLFFEEFRIPRFDWFIRLE